MKTVVFFFILAILCQNVKSQTIKINEFMASNKTTITDEFGDYDDWIEIYNYGNQAFNIGGYFITDKLDNPTKYQFPTGTSETIIPPQGFLLLWADNDSLQNGPLHLPFKLSASGEAIGIFAPNGVTPIDTITFGQQIPDISYGRYPDGNDNWLYFNFPTPGQSNSLVNIDKFNTISKQITVFPNPAKGTMIFFDRIIEIIDVYNSSGIQVNEYYATDKIDITNYQSGIYMYRSRNDGLNGKFIVIK